MLVRSSLLALSLLAALTTASGCGNGDGDDAAGTESFGGPDASSGDGDGDADSGDGDADSGDGDAGDGGDGDGDPDLDICLPSCATASDCALGAAGTAYDEDNYACDQGACVYLGCYSDAECDVTQTGSLVCRAQAGATPTCVTACATNAECGIPGDTAGPYGPDNYACDDGGCRFTGCNGDAECQTLGDYVCTEAGGFSYCIQSCQVPTDCVIAGAGAAYDADNYGCNAGTCAYLGCLSDRECAALGDYICQ